MGQEENYRKILSFRFFRYDPKKSDSGNSFNRFLARFCIEQNYLGTTDFNIGNYKTTPNEKLRTILRHKYSIVMIFPVSLERYHFSDGTLFLHLHLVIPWWPRPCSQTYRGGFLRLLLVRWLAQRCSRISRTPWTPDSKRPCVRFAPRMISRRC